MVIPSGDALGEYGAELAQLKVLDDELEEVAAGLARRRGEIKARVKEIAAALGGPTARVVLPAGAAGAWDRVVQHRGAGLDVARLEEALGTAEYRRLVCVRQVVYAPAPEKIEAARLAGRLTDAALAAAEAPGTPTPTLRKMSPAQLQKHRAGAGDAG